MPHVKLFAAAFAAGVTAILLLGRLPMLEPQLQSLRHAAAVSVPYRQIVLSDDNLADAVSSLAIRHRISRVGWDHSILTVDFALRDGETDANALWDDMLALVRFSFGEAANVRQTLVRVYRPAEGRRTLLIYGDPRREDWPPDRLAGLQAPESGREKVFLESLRLSTTPAGERWMTNLAK